MKPRVNINPSTPPPPGVFSHYLLLSTDTTFFPAFRSCVFTVISLPGEGNIYNGLRGEAPPERSTFFRLQVYEREGKSVISVCEKEKMANRCILWQWKLKTFWFCDLFVF